MKTKRGFQSVCNLLFIYVIVAVLGASLLHQFFRNDPPCDLCLLQRSAMLGIAASLLFNLRDAIRVQYYALALANAFLGLLVSYYHIAIHLDPAIGHTGIPVLGLPLYFWSLIIFSCALFAIIILLFLLGIMGRPTKLKSKIWEISAYFFTLVLAITLLLTTYPR